MTIITHVIIAVCLTVIRNNSEMSNMTLSFCENRSLKKNWHIAHRQGAIRVAAKPAWKLKLSMADLLTPKYKILVGSWNVRTLYQAGKLQQVLREMINYKVEILRVSEAIWTDSGRRILTSGHTIFYSGRTDNLHRGGVAVIATSKVEKTLLEWKSVNQRLIKLRFN